MHYLKKDKKDEESGHGYNAFHNLDKTMVLQEARVFNESPVNSKKCLQVLTKILYIVNQNEPIGLREATECFFATTKLFQSKDPILRRMVYLVIKDMASLAQDVIIVTSSLTKDMTGREDMYRGPAIRTLCSITDHTMIQAIERYMKQAIVDKNYTVASAALTSSMHLCKAQGGEIVKRWINELQEAINSDNVMVQYHALGLIYQVKKSDKLAISKLFSKFSKGSLRSPYAYVLLIRITCQLIADDEGSNYANTGPYFDFVESCLRHKSEMVVFEAASALVNMHKPGSSVSSSKQQLAPAISVLQLFCSSPNAALRFAAVKTLNKVAMSQPSAVMSCNVDLETLITDSNRSVATLAITTLLKTGSESSIDRLMKQISTFMNEISDPFKITVVKAIQSLCLKFPRKHAVMMNFLSGMLREEGGFDYKRAIVETIVSIIQDNPEAKETGLAHLCEFIEDCEHAVLAVKILHLLGAEGPKTPQPSKYIRYIYNRVILEAPPVRSAAVSALAKFALYCDDDLKASIGVLLSRCLLDTDDEVRDRATYYLTLLGGAATRGGQNQGSEGQGLDTPVTTEQLIQEEEEEDVAMREEDGGQDTKGAQFKMAAAASYIDNEMHISVPCLERSLLNYLAKGDFGQASFDLKSVPIEETKPQDSTKGDFGPGPVGPTSEDGAMGFPKKKAEIEMQGLSRESLYMETLSKIAAFSTLGPLFKSCAPVKLTEDETEYVVQCIKHIFTNYVVFQFDVTNTLTDQILENVVIAMEPSEEQFHVAKSIAAKECKPVELETESNSSASNVAYTCVRLPEESVLVSCTFTNVMKFKVRDCDPATGEIGGAAYDDQYTIEDLELGVSDSMKAVAKHNFGAAWEELGPENELEDSFVLSNIKTLEEAVNKLIQFLGMSPCDSSDKIGEGKNLHTLYLSGIYRGGHDILSRIKIVVIPETGVTMNMVVRSSDPAASEVLVTAMG